MTERQLEAKQTARRNLKSASTAHHCQAQTHLCAGKPNKIKTISNPRTGLLDRLPHLGDTDHGIAVDEVGEGLLRQAVGAFGALGDDDVAHVGDAVVP